MSDEEPVTTTLLSRFVWMSTSHSCTLRGAQRTVQTTARAYVLAAACMPCPSSDKSPDRARDSFMVQVDTGMRCSVPGHDEVRGAPIVAGIRQVNNVAARLRTVTTGANGHLTRT
jgi:hypothetical protein